MGWKGFNIEPVPWVYQKLLANRPSSVSLNFALSNKNGSTIFNAVNHPHFGTNCTNGSLCHTDQHKKWLDDIGCSFLEVSVALKRWDKFICEQGITHIDLLVLDVEGHEIQVIEGMEGCSVLPSIVCVGVGHLDLDLLRKLLARLGYVYDISSHVNAFFVKQELLGLFALRRQNLSKLSNSEINISKKN